MSKFQFCIFWWTRKWCNCQINQMSNNLAFVKSVGTWRASFFVVAPDRKWSETYPFSQIANDTGRTFSDGLPLKAEVSFAKRRIIFKRNLICITKTAPLITLALQFQSAEWNSPLPFPCTSFSSKLNQLLSFFLQRNTWIKINERLDEIGAKFIQLSTPSSTFWLGSI